MTAIKSWTICVLTSLVTFALGVFVASLDRRRPEYREQIQREVRQEQSQWEVLLSFLNRDLSKLDPPSKATLRHAVDSVTAAIDPELSPRLTPRVFRLVSNTAGQQHYLLVEEANSRVVPVLCIRRKRDQAGLYSTQWPVRSDWTRGCRTYATVQLMIGKEL